MVLKISSSMLKKLCSCVKLLCSCAMSLCSCCALISKSDPGFVIIVFMVCESADTERVFFFSMLKRQFTDKQAKLAFKKNFSPHILFSLS